MLATQISHDPKGTFAGGIGMLSDDADEMEE